MGCKRDGLIPIAEVLAEKLPEINRVGGLADQERNALTMLGPGSGLKPLRSVSGDTSA